MGRHRAVGRISERRLSFESLEARHVLSAGVTIITHGAQLGTGLPDWTVSMGQAILDRADGADTSRTAGSIFRHDPATGRWAPLDPSVWTNSNNPSDQVVLLYDWSSESFALEDGWLEGAADNLFASLVDANAYLPAGLAGKSFLDVALAAGGGGGLLGLHFISHSRGGPLTSLVAERFDHYFPALTIDQITSLDPHPAGPMDDPGYSAANPSATSFLTTYDNVRFADNYFQQDGNYEPLLPPDFDGVHANGAYNFQLPSAVLENGGASLEHSDVHTWYYGTITAPFAANYAGFSGAGRDNDGDTTFPAAWYGTGGVPARNAIGFAFTQIGGASRDGLQVSGVKSAASDVPTIYNGDLSRAIDGLFGDSLPGWERHSGGGTAPLGGGADLYFELNSGSSDFVRIHNPLYVPRNTTAIEYDFWINDNDAAGPDDLLAVLVGDTVVDVLSLAATTTGFIRDRQAAFSFATSGLVATVTFLIFDGTGDGVESAVRIDNVRLVVQPPTSSGDFNGDAVVDGADVLAWQRGLGTYVHAMHAVGDANFDGNVLADDLTVWQAAVGTQGRAFASPASEPQAVSSALEYDALYAVGDLRALFAEAREYRPVRRARILF